MKKYLAHIIPVFVFIVTIAFIGVVYADGSGSKNVAESEIQTDTDEYGIVSMDASDITVSGTINATNQLIDDKGQSFELSENTEEGVEVKALVGHKVELKATVMESNGQQVLEVSDYKILDK
jgi:hypothetical protein